MEWRWELTVPGNGKSLCETPEIKIIPCVFKELNVIQYGNRKHRPDLGMHYKLFGCLDFTFRTMDIGFQ